MENAEGTRFENDMEKMSIIKAEFVGRLERTDTVLGKSDKIRDIGLIWKMGHDNFLDREVEIHFQNLPQRLTKTKKWQINLFRE